MSIQQTFRILSATALAAAILLFNPAGDRTLARDERSLMPTPASTLISGIVTDKGTRQPVKVQVIFVDLRTGENVTTSKSNSSTGKYTAVLEPGHDYGLGVVAEGYLPAFDNYSIPEGAPYSEPVIDFAISKLKSGDKVVLKHALFDGTSPVLTGSIKADLTVLSAFMEANPVARVELVVSGGGSGKGKAVQKNALAQATAARDYLVNTLNISAPRITAKGNSGKGSRLEAKITLK